MYKSAKLGATRAIVPYVHHALRAFVSHVPRVLRALVPYMPRALRALVSRALRASVPQVPLLIRLLVLDVPHALSVLVPYVLSCFTCIVYSCTSRVLRLAFSCAARASCRTRSFAPHLSLASDVSSLTYLYACYTYIISAIRQDLI